MKKEIKDKLEEVEKWFKENPKLPAEIDPLLLRRFLKCMNYDVEETKKLIELNYSLRNKNPNIFIDRDPHEEGVKNVLARGEMVPLPGLTPEGNKLIIYRMIDFDASKLNTLDDCKVFYMLTDARFIVPDLDELDEDEEKPKTDNNNDENDVKNQDDDNEVEDKDKEEDVDLDEKEEEDDEHKYASGEIQIVDYTGLTMSHITRMTFSIMRVHMKFMQEAYPVPMRAMHVINPPPFVNRILAIFRPFVNDDVFGLMHFHTDSDSLYEHVPRDMLPDEYGGKAGNMSELRNKWTDKMMKKRDYLMDPKHWKAEHVESRRWFWW